MENSEIISHEQNKDPSQEASTCSENSEIISHEQSKDPSQEASTCTSGEIISHEQSTQSKEDVKDFGQYRDLYRAAQNGDWKTVKKLVGEHSAEAKTDKITEFGTTLLHLAVRKHETMWLVNEILEAIGSDQLSLLEQADIFGGNAISYAVREGNIEATTILVDKSNNFLRLKDQSGFTPLVLAAGFGNKEIVKLLLPTTIAKATDLLIDASLFEYLIEAKMYGIAFHILQLPILKQHMELDKDHLIKKRVLRTLARKPQEFASGNHNLNYWQRLIYQWIPVTEEKDDYPLISISISISIDNSAKSTKSGFFQRISNIFGKLYLLFWNIMKRTVPWINDIHDKKLSHMQALELVKFICKGMINLKFKKALNICLEPLYTAARLGIVELVHEIIEENPDSTYYGDDNDNGLNIFQLAVLYRQEHVFKLIYKMDRSKYLVTFRIDNEDNNILHLAGKLQPSSRIPGAALQMQRELQWFKAIEKIVMNERPCLLEGRNKDKLTPREVFTQEHNVLVQEGQKWMKDIAQSYIIVTSLIITVTFAAAFTVPGGTGEKGIPTHLHDSALKTFVVADASALIFSCTSVLMYLGILTSRYSEEDFLISLPTKLIWGLITLYISLGCMMVSFYAALYIVFHHPKKQVFFSIIPLVSFAMFLSAIWQFPLLFEILRSTYGHDFLQPNKPNRFSSANFKNIVLSTFYLVK